MARIGFYRVARAFLEGREASLKNDRTFATGALAVRVLTYHGNTIARMNHDGSIDVTLAGWNTVTTRSRLNQLASMLDSDWRVFTKRFEPYSFHWRTPDAPAVEMGERDWYTIREATRLVAA